LAAALAAGEAETADGRAVTLAYIVGFEVGATLGAALNPEHYTRGWHATSTIGTLGCAAAAARLLRLDVIQTRHALAIAATHASGLKENFGSMTKPYHAGHAARNGILAAQLAREGLTAPAAALAEGRVDLRSFEDGEVRNHAVRDLMERITVVVDPALPDELARHAWSRVTVRVRDGRTLTAGPRGARGHPDTPLDPDALRAKFRACATLVLPRDEAEGVAEQLAHLEDIPDIRALTSRLAGDLDRLIGGGPDGPL